MPGLPGEPDLRRPVWRLERAPLAARLAPNLLRGAGLFARVRAADLAAAADPADADGNGVSGEVAWRPAGAGRKPGRFGWKTEAASLGERVATALALDLGIATPAHPDPAGDCTPAQLACRAHAGTGAPVAPAAFAALGRYLGALRPWPGPPAPAGDRGEALFAEVGCAACHRPSFAVASDPAVTGRTTERIAPFTDLLLHDLGPALADPGGPAGLAAEWRTAPL